jgi:hypothetical protein
MILFVGGFFGFFVWVCWMMAVGADGTSVVS